MTLETNCILQAGQASVNCTIRAMMLTSSWLYRSSLQLLRMAHGRVRQAAACSIMAITLSTWYAIIDMYPLTCE